MGSRSSLPPSSPHNGTAIKNFFFGFPKGGTKWELFHQFELQYSGQLYSMSNRLRITNLQKKLQNFADRLATCNKKNTRHQD